MNTLLFAENFSQMQFLSDSELDDEGNVVHELSFVNLRPVMITLAIVVLLLPMGMIAIDADAKVIIGIPVAAALFGVCVIGVLWLMKQLHKNAKLPSVDKDTDELVLASGRRIASSSIQVFRQFDCKTNVSNFRLKLTSVVTRDNEQYAVCVEIRRNTSGSIGKQIADYFGHEIESYPSVIKSPGKLKRLGIQ